MLMIILAIILLLAFANSVWIDRVYRSLPLHELRRRARGKDKHSSALYKLAAFGPSLELLLWLKGSLSGIILMIWAARTSWWLALITGLVMSYMVVAGRYSRTAADWQIHYVSVVAPLIARVLEIGQPVFGRIADVIRSHRPVHPPTGLYERDDLLELLKHQTHQSDSRISEVELAIAQGALSFGKKTVGHVMTPRAKLKIVAASDSIGPMLMDELHASGLSSFVVVKELSRAANPEIVGTLYLSDLVDHGDSGKVRDLAKHHVYFINEAQDLTEALAAFIKTKAHLLIVVNNFEELAGALSIEQVIHQILGHKLSSEFDRYDDLSAVAGLQSGQDHKNHNEVDVAPKQK